MHLPESETGSQGWWSQFQTASRADKLYIWVFEFAFLAMNEQDMLLPSSSHQGQRFCLFPSLVVSKEENKRIKAFSPPQVTNQFPLHTAGLNVCRTSLLFSVLESSFITGAMVRCCPFESVHLRRSGFSFQELHSWRCTRRSQFARLLFRTRHQSQRVWRCILRVLLWLFPRPIVR